LGIGLNSIPRFFSEYPTPRRVGYTLPKLRENSKLMREEIGFCNSGKSSGGLGRESTGGRRVYQNRHR